MKRLLPYRTLLALLLALVLFAAYWGWTYCWEYVILRNPALLYRTIHTWSPLLPSIGGLLLGLCLTPPPKRIWPLVVVQLLVAVFLLWLAFHFLSLQTVGMLFPFYYTASTAQGAAAVLGGALVGFSVTCILPGPKGDHPA